LWQVLSIAIQVTHPEDNLGLWATAETMSYLSSLLFIKERIQANAAKGTVRFANKYHCAPL